MWVERVGLDPDRSDQVHVLRVMSTVLLKTPTDRLSPESDPRAPSMNETLKDIDESDIQY